MTKTIIKREFRRHVFILCATLAIMLLISSCGTPNINATEEMPATRFVEVYHSQYGLKGDTIYMDTETSVLYYYHASGYGGGLCVMYDKDSNVLTGK